MLSKKSVLFNLNNLPTIVYKNSIFSFIQHFNNILENINKEYHERKFENFFLQNWFKYSALFAKYWLITYGFIKIKITIFFVVVVE